MKKHMSVLLLIVGHMGKVLGEPVFNSFENKITNDGSMKCIEIRLAHIEGLQDYTAGETFDSRPKGDKEAFYQKSKPYGYLDRYCFENEKALRELLQDLEKSQKEDQYMLFGLMGRQLRRSSFFKLSDDGTDFDMLPEGTDLSKLLPNSVIMKVLIKDPNTSNVELGVAAWHVFRSRVLEIDNDRFAINILLPQSEK